MLRRGLLPPLLALALLLPFARAALASDLLGDVNGDCTVNVLDLSILSSRYLTARGSLLYRPEYDVNGDGVINILDLQVVAGHFGTAC
jgi:hypothetical protein